MIRESEPEDIHDVLDVWLFASIQAHGFMDRTFWESNMDAMRDIYIPGSDTYVFKENETIKGFFCLHGDVLAAMFVAPEFQGKGIGRKLMDKAKSLRNRLELTVYKENPKSMAFYQRCGFEIITEKVDDPTGHMEVLMRYAAD